MAFISVKAAAVVWRRFVACVEALPLEQAAPLWRAAQEQTAKAADGDAAGIGL